MLRTLSLAFCLGLAAPAASAQTIIYVDVDASGSETGTSWANAYEELDEALEAATAPAEIWVAEGVYRPTDDPDRAESFRLKSGVTILGGFTGTETSADQRTPDPDEGGTVLSGDIGTADDPSDNSYHVVTASGADGTAVLDGFIITGGVADGSVPNDRGAGLYTSGGFPTLRNVFFEDNIARFGGGMFMSVSTGTTILEDVEFKENEGTTGGGGLYVDGRIEGEGVEFEENVSAERGAGLFASRQAVVVLRDVEFDTNAVGEDGQSAPARGGGVHTQNDASVTLIDAEFELNTASGAFGDGAGINAQGGTVAVINGVFVGNVSRLGPAVTTRNGSPTVSMTNVVVAGNQSDEDNGGALYFSESTVATLSGLSVSGNDGQAAVRIVNNAQVEVFNTIVWDNDGPALLDESTGGAFDVDHAIIEGGFSGGESVLADDPLFVRAPDDGPDDDWGTEDDDYGDLRLREGSPALDFGDQDLVPEDELDLDGDGVTGELLPIDLDGEMRVQGGRVDLGPYEGAETVVSVEGAPEASGVALTPAAPNPVRTQATLSLSVREATDVTVAVFDALGREVAVLHDGPLAAGTHEIRVRVGTLPAGVYHIRAVAGTTVAARPFTVAR